MGHSYSSLTSFSSVYSNSQQIQEIIEKGKWKDIDEIVKYQVSVDFDASVDRNNNKKYVIKLDSDIPHNCNMTLLFPKNDVGSSVLWTKSYLGHIMAFSREINERLDKCNRAEKGPPLVVTSNVSFYAFDNILGKIYLLWANRVNISTQYESLRQIYENVPVVVETNGKMCIRNIFLFNELQPINVKNVEIIMPINTFLFCCESDPRQQQQDEDLVNIVMLNEKDTEEFTEECVDESLRTITEDEILLK